MFPSQTSVDEDIIVQTIVPSGTRFESRFAKGTPHKSILAALNHQKATFGFDKHEIREKKFRGTKAVVHHEDMNSGYRFDNPETIVSIVSVVDGECRELSRLKGPPISSPEIDYPCI